MTAPSPRWLPLVGVLALLWNGIGVYAYLGDVGMAPRMGPTPVVAMPVFIHAAFAIGVFAAVIGSLGLIMRKRWARPVLWLSFVSTVIDWIWIFGWSVQGVTALGVTVLVLSLAQAMLTENAAKRGWLR